MKKLLFIFLFATPFLFANNLTITNVTKTSENQLTFDVSWDNSWWVATYRDASWIFIKYKNSSGQWQHLNLTSATAVGFTYNFPDNKGVMLSRSVSGQGTITGTVTVNFSGGALGPLPDFKVFGIEMVYINQGPFYVGDGEGTLTKLYQGNDINSPFYVQNSGVITVGNTANDLKGWNLNQNIPATFPNGYDDFYMMKYDVTQEQYAEFLNTLTIVQQQTRTKTDLSAVTTSNRFVMTATATPSKRNGIACDANANNTMPITFYCDLNNNGVPNENNDGQNIINNVVSIADIGSYIDWTCLRLPTEFEYEKACRGTAYPIINEYANGTIIYNGVGVIMNNGMPNETYTNIGINGLNNSNANRPLRAGGLATSTSTRLQSGAGFYGNMDLNGNGHKIVVSGYSIGYSSDFGDGYLDINGNQNNWNSLSYLSYKGGYGLYLPISIRTTNNNLTINDNARNYPKTIRACR